MNSAAAQVWEHFSPWLGLALGGIFPYLLVSLAMRRALAASRLRRGLWLAGLATLLLLPGLLLIDGDRHRVRFQEGFFVMAGLTPETFRAGQGPLAVRETGVSRRHPWRQGGTSDIVSVGLVAAREKDVSPLHPWRQRGALPTSCRSADGAATGGHPPGGKPCWPT